MPALLVIASPLGRLQLEANGLGLSRISFLDGRREHVATPGDASEDRNEPAPLRWPVADHPAPRGVAEASAAALLQQAARELEEYFAGRRRQFTLALDLRGAPFQRRVWQELARIPYGTMISYRSLAAAAGRPRAIRAAGAANGANPLPVVVPCHRVIGSDGSLTGYRGGLAAKHFLLTLEQRAPTDGDREAATCRSRSPLG